MSNPFQPRPPVLPPRRERLIQATQRLIQANEYQPPGERITINRSDLREVLSLLHEAIPAADLKGN